ncbi:MAG: helix-hairpin-helix domain-containing protein, partial [Desulfobacterales bacterium]
MNTKKKKYDDLTKIKGIGLHRQQWLKKSFGVCTFSDLAALTIDEIETRLKSERSGVGRKTIEFWIDEAKELAEAASPERGMEAATVESGGGASLPSGETQWNSLASFQVDFQTR